MIAFLFQGVPPKCIFSVRDIVQHQPRPAELVPPSRPFRQHQPPAGRAEAGLLWLRERHDRFPRRRQKGLLLRNGGQEGYAHRPHVRADIQSARGESQGQKLFESTFTVNAFDRRRFNLRTSKDLEFDLNDSFIAPCTNQPGSVS